ncbi:MAG: hypothetical protein LBE20_05375 [Deltaproteobacteria bacterium]|jgi:hypothetical protein|nr:hypothetical protein [Deltaproteobacteria bacterium]
MVSRQTLSSTLLSTHFILQEYHVREEEWGAVVGTVEGIGSHLVSSDTLALLRGFEVGKEYSTCGVLLNFSQIDKENFLKGMASRGLLKFV